MVKGSIAVWIEDDVEMTQAGIIAATAKGTNIQNPMTMAARRQGPAAQNLNVDAATARQMRRKAVAACLDEEGMATVSQRFDNSAVAPEVADDDAATHLSYCGDHELSSTAKIGSEIQHFAAAKNIAAAMDVDLATAIHPSIVVHEASICNTYAAALHKDERISTSLSDVVVATYMTLGNSRTKS
ncbi:hypothetical protein ACH5RR_034021 [Cinchona calisaya]|uniref:Uncharacterized protein n=1 Tax=Cinchona calisaya TaxID=153742 RepID=A0ABD2YD96_9GENT